MPVSLSLIISNNILRCHLVRLTVKRQKKLQQSYYDFCVDYYNHRCLEVSTKQLYVTIIEDRIKPYFGNMAIGELTKGILQAFVDKYTTNIKKMFTVLNATLSKLYSLDLIPEDFSKRLIKPDVKIVKQPQAPINNKMKYHVFFITLRGIG